MTRSPKIKSIIFDLGGVLLNLDQEKTREGLAALANDERIVSQNVMEPSFLNEFERGHITSETFRSKMRQHLSSDADDASIDQAWNAMLLDLPPERMKLVADLKSQAKVFLLSNINAIHYEAVMETVTEAVGFEEFHSCFHQTYYSHLIGARKPDAASYQKILYQHVLDPEETLFIDDSLANIEGAKSIKLKTIHFTDGLNLFDIDFQNPRVEEFIN